MIPSIPNPHLPDRQTGWRVPLIHQSRSEHCQDALTTYVRAVGLLFSSVDIVRTDPRPWLAVSMRSHVEPGLARQGQIQVDIRKPPKALIRPRADWDTQHRRCDEDERLTLAPNQPGWIHMQSTHR
ncbi:uncharacterized protein PV07_11954 [Cladophialophora immunda]|uniref:Uncharacterized protein n=1 Tax=Cladophialophora immunda TaxID=569365 RepID=A0A0D2BXB7_9EURO|nr:uncharacterized protein PV07_11954 [Cladophialophora immunda]KIW23778.1 hypothetical protein PV07_11954 [Cladophialophora immunda]